MNGEKTKRIALSCAALLFAACAFAQNGRVSWSTFDMGFASPTGGNAQAISAIGQGFAAPAGSGNARVHSGFLASLMATGTTSVPGSEGGIPAAFSLSQNFPNPFNPSTNIQFSIVNRQLTIVTVLDLLGREVKTLVNEVKEPGTYTVNFDGSNLASGIYFYKLTAGEFVRVCKMILIR